MNEGFGKDFYRKGDSVKRSRPFSEPPDSENSKVAVLIPFPKNSSEKINEKPLPPKEGLRIRPPCRVGTAVKGFSWKGFWERSAANWSH